MTSLRDLRAFHLVYLATPYTKYPRGPECAFIDAAKLGGALFNAGIRVYSPIVHGHPFSRYGGVPPFDHQLWLDFDQAMISVSSALLVGKLEGWEKSYGVSEELLRFTCAGKPIFYVDPETLEVTDDRIENHQ